MGTLLFPLPALQTYHLPHTAHIWVRVLGMLISFLQATFELILMLKHYT